MILKGLLSFDLRVILSIFKYTLLFEQFYAHSKTEQKI
jgi:hypothetical protein